MRIRIIYALTAFSILLIIGITVYYNFHHISLADRCPDSCGNWVYGSCIDKQLYMERECYNYTAGCVKQGSYFESKIVTADACSQSDCLEGKTFVDYRCE